MIKTILVRATGDASGEAAYAAAHSLARRFGAHIDALHVRVDPVEVAVAVSSEGASGMFLEKIIDNLERDADAEEARARRRFTTFCADAGVPIADPAANAGRLSAMFHVETGQESSWMCTYGRGADLVIAPRGVPNNDAVARATLEPLLFETGRPLFIPAAIVSTSAVADHVAIAWKATPEAARAVAFALPFLVDAAKVTILAVEEEDGHRDEAARLVRYLACHRIGASLERLTAGTAGAAATLLAAAKARSGLLVMGGYGHTRLREWIFGGFTQRALDHAELPVLMVH